MFMEVKQKQIRNTWKGRKSVLLSRWLGRGTRVCFIYWICNQHENQGRPSNLSALSGAHMLIERNETTPTNDANDRVLRKRYRYVIRGDHYQACATECLTVLRF